MFKHILLATSDRDLEDILFDYLDEAEHNSVPTPARNGESLSRKLTADGWQDYDLLIIDNAVYPDREKCPPQKADTGLALLKALKADGVDLPSILLVDEVNATLMMESRRLGNCQLVIKHGVLDENIELAIGQLQQLVRVKPSNGEDEPQASDYEAMIEIDISSERNQLYHFRYRNGSKPVNSPPKPLAVQWPTLQNLCENSRMLRNLEDDWEPPLELIGRVLNTELQRSQDFFSDFAAIKGLGSDLQNLFIRFSLSRETYGLACEALYDDDRGFLMLQAPLTRKVNRAQLGDPLMLSAQGERDPINILFIEADVDGYVPSLGHEVAKLENIQVERRYFEQIDGDQTERNPNIDIGRIHILSQAAGGDDFKTTVERCLTGKSGDKDLPKTFHIVHFAGHSVFDEHDEDDLGSLVFPGETPEAVRIREFAQWLKEAGTQLAYLSSCSSSDAEVAFELAQEGVPTVIGFRWDVEDQLAARYAKYFYDGLLYDQPSLEQAFLAARRKMNAKDVKNRIWAAPTMIHQIQD